MSDAFSVKLYAKIITLLNIFQFSVGVLSVLIVGMIASWISGPQDMKKINPDLISPIIHGFLPKECFDKYNGSQRSSIDPTTELFHLRVGENSRRIEFDTNTYHA